MKRHEFVIIASGLDPDDEDFDDLFYEAGCSDATLVCQKGAIIVDFEREAPSFADALVSACRDVHSTGATIERVEPDHLVNLSEVADRAGLTRQAVALYSDGQRGEGFPRPVAKVTSKTPLWDWSEVADWLNRNGKLAFEAVVQARIVREANLHFEADGRVDVSFAKKLESVGALEVA